MTRRYRAVLLEEDISKPKLEGCGKALQGCGCLIFTVGLFLFILILLAAIA